MKYYHNFFRKNVANICMFEKYFINYNPHILFTKLKVQHILRPMIVILSEHKINS